MRKGVNMCDTSAYIRAEGEDVIYLESLARIEVDGDMLILVSIFGDRKSLNGRIIEVNLQGGKVVMERL